MIRLNDYLDLTTEDARGQWRAVLARGPSIGRNQVDYLPIETLICFGLGLVTPPSRSGTVNLRASSPTVQLFAHLFRRTPKSLAAKLANLDGRRPHSARYEKELWVHLTSRDNSYLGLYTTILAAAREIGLGKSDVPDFLGVGSAQFQVVLDAVDINDDELSASVAEWADDTSTNLDPLTERAMVGTARVGQQQFARRVLENSDYACAFCGLSARKHGIPPSRLLIASHIKPWSESTNSERLDTRNGLAACPTHDAAFESHLIAVDRSGRIIRSEAVQRAVTSDPAWDRAFGLGTLASSLQLTDGGRLPRPAFVDWHWAHRPLEVELAYS
ncbi:HNH endonuclease [Agromyces sp. NPDC058484]|uniref:HNH endonuclease n=1 Tax=Agromyces sp. NPDC058484 TaxID=3346524 RepID=UPI00365E1CFD